MSLPCRQPATDSAINCHGHEGEAPTWCAPRTADMQQHPGIGLGGFRKPPTSVDCCLRSQTNDPAMQAACHRQCNHFSGCSRPVGAGIGLQAVRGAHQGLGTAPVGCPGSWGLGGGQGESFANHRRLGPPSRRPPGHQNQSCRQSSRERQSSRDARRLPQSRWEIQSSRDARRFFRLVALFVECNEQKCYMFPNETGPAV